jgi:hypothetical protein
MESSFIQTGSNGKELWFNFVYSLEELLKQLYLLGHFRVSVFYFKIFFNKISRDVHAKLINEHTFIFYKAPQMLQILNENFSEWWKEVHSPKKAAYVFCIFRYFI